MSCSFADHQYLFYNYQPISNRKFLKELSRLVFKCSQNIAKKSLNYFQVLIDGWQSSKLSASLRLFLAMF